jgi:hypothetical protein
MEMLGGSRAATSTRFGRLPSHSGDKCLHIRALEQIGDVGDAEPVDEHREPRELTSRESSAVT